MIAKCSTTQKLDFLRDRQNWLLNDMKNDAIHSVFGKLPEFPEFKPIGLEDRELINHYTAKYKPVSCEYSFANLFCWGELYNFAWSIYAGRLVIYSGVDKQILMPLGRELPFTDLRKLHYGMIQINPGNNISQVSDDYLIKYPEISRHYSIYRNGAQADYIYSARKLFELNGTKLGKKRNLISQFKRKWPDYVVENMGHSNIDSCRALAGQQMQKHLKVNRSIREEKAALNRAFDYFDDIGLEGLVLKISGQVAAFAVFSKLHNLMYATHYEKSDLNFKGAAQVINQETARFLMGKCKYINREQDLGLPGLRQAKLSYCPDLVYSVNTLMPL